LCIPLCLLSFLYFGQYIDSGGQDFHFEQGRAPADFGSGAPDKSAYYQKSQKSSTDKLPQVDQEIEIAQ
jgi:hypothetical protein